MDTDDSPLSSFSFDSQQFVALCELFWPPCWWVLLGRMEIQMKMIAVVGLISLVGQWGHAWLITLRLSLLDNVVVHGPAGKVIESWFPCLLESSWKFWNFFPFSRARKVLEIWCQGPEMFLNLLLFKFDKFALRSVRVQLLKNYGLLLT